MTVRIILVRHGESSYNLERRIQGRMDLSVLTERGIEQARCVGSALEGMRFRQAYCSPLKRAHRTAEEIVAGCPDLALQITPLLQEIDISAWAGMTFDEVQQKFPDDYQIYRHSPQNLQLADQYPVRELYQQAQEFWDLLRTQHPDLTEHGPAEGTVNLLSVGHSGINRALVSTALGIGPHHYQRLGQDNCAISVLTFSEGLGHPPQLESLNVTTHLDQPLPRYKGGIRILLVRHGETDWNRDQRFQGQRDIPLNTTGLEQAEQVATFLKDVSIDLAISSPLKRSWDTGAAVCRAHGRLEIKPIPDLQEISHGLWEGKLKSEIEAEFPGQLGTWLTDPGSVQMPQGENLDQVWDRTRIAWAELLRIAEAKGRDLTVLVTAHDAINKAAICLVFGLDPDSFWTFKQGNGGVTVFDYPEGAEGLGILKASNLTAHMAGGILDCTTAGAL